MEDRLRKLEATVQYTVKRVQKIELTALMREVRHQLSGVLRSLNGELDLSRITGDHKRDINSAIRRAADHVDHADHYLGEVIELVE